MSIQEKIKQLTLKEKISLICGGDFWDTAEVKRLNIPAMMLVDGPHGLRKQVGKADNLGVNNSIKAVCFPTASATAASFDRKMLYDLGDTLGTFAKQENIGVLLGPAMNIKRSPLCGRNFEYFSEDPYVAGNLAESYVKGVQKHHVGTSPKHFAVNNQEYRRMSSSSNLDERTLREIYLPAFERVVKKAHPMTMMASYNKINGVSASANNRLLNEILRKEWGFDGLVVSDWGAVNNRVASLKAGLDLSMPASENWNKELESAVKDHKLSEKDIDVACERILRVISETIQKDDDTSKLTLEEGHKRAEKFAEDSLVLLKNNDVLPLNKKEKVAFIGSFAKVPRYQGGGSSHINNYKSVGALEAVKDIANVEYSEGYSLDDDKSSDEMIEKAVEVAKSMDKIVVFAGLPDSYESEGYDRSHMNLPKQQNELIEALTKTSAKVIVVLHNGAPIEMPWLDEIDGLLECYLAGEAVGEATVNTLYGINNPSGRLPETFPLRLADTPTYLTYDKTKNNVQYSEGVFVGYRYYASKKMKVAFPFGSGLSYTSFAYRDLQTDKSEYTDQEKVNVSVTVINTGDRKGKEVVQLYVAPKDPSLPRPIRELKAFTKVELNPGESKKVTFELDSRAFSYWNEDINNWYAESGNYKLEIAKNADTVLLDTTIKIKSTFKIKETFTPDTVMGDILNNPAAAKALDQMMGDGSEGLSDPGQGDKTVSRKMMMAIIADMPLRKLTSYIPGFDDNALNQMVMVLNQSQKQ